MSYPITYQKLFDNAGAGPKLREDIVPKTIARSNEVVKHTEAQSLTTTQQKQALANIGAVSYLNNTLTKAQSARARTNIDAQSASELTTALSELIKEYGGTVPS